MTRRHDTANLTLELLDGLDRFAKVTNQHAWAPPARNYEPTPRHSGVDTTATMAAQLAADPARRAQRNLIAEVTRAHHTIHPHTLEPCSPRTQITRWRLEQILTTLRSARHIPSRQLDKAVKHLCAADRIMVTWIRTARPNTIGQRCRHCGEPLTRTARHRPTGGICGPCHQFHTDLGRWPTATEIDRRLRTGRWTVLANTAPTR